jgi:hypothetical protein
MAKIIYMQESGRVFFTSYPELHKGALKLPQAKGAALYRKQVKTELLERVKPAQKVYCNLLSVSASGMQRRIELFIVEKGEICNITFSASIVTNRKFSDKGGIICKGCGMDMGFDLVYSLGSALWPTGTPAPHGKRNGEEDSAGGYALRSQWL